jgi:hypothetical protein
MHKPARVDAFMSRAEDADVYYSYTGPIIAREKACTTERLWHACNQDVIRV